MAPPAGSTSATGFSSTGAIVVAVLVAFAGMDVLTTFKEAEKDVSSMPTAANNMGQTTTTTTTTGGNSLLDEKSLGGKVHISYCNSCSYRGGFMQVNQVIRQHFPGTEVVGSHYPPYAMNVAISKLVSFATMGAVGTAVFGDKIFEMLGMPTPELATQMQANKMGSCMGAWFLGNILHTNLLNTGAFEIYYDGKVLFSKLQEKRLPNIPEILQGIGDHIKNSSVDPPAGEAPRAIPDSDAGADVF